ncbi:MAG TPA: response regulator, partial [Burkholderiales bacterium]|nr:response regulator [Burkholderiales bacterium]
ARSAGRNQGSEFIVRLPALREQQPATLESVENSALHAAALRVLVVDDNEDAAISLSMLLEMAGNTVRTAQDGEKALEIAAELRPHVVLLDLGLPKMNGYEVARGIREQPWGREMMLIAVTGWGEASDKQRTSEAGFNQHIVKPVDAQALLSLLAELPGAR